MQTKKRILIVDDESGIRTVLSVILQQGGYETLAAATGEDALELLEQTPVDLVISDLALGRGIDGLELLRRIRERCDIPVVIITAFGTVRVALDAMREGAYDFIRKPLKMEDIYTVVRGALRHHAWSRGQLPALDAEAQVHFDCLVGESPSMQAVYRLIERIAVLETPILVQGERGAGKSACARAIHQNGRRRANPLFEVDCARMNSDGIGPALFGDSVVATGRDWFEAGGEEGGPGAIGKAWGGTLVIDNIEHMPISVQKRLEIFLESLHRRVKAGFYEKTGGIRLIAGAGTDLSLEVDAGHFELGLYNILSVLVIELPPLRRRIEDVPLLTAHLLRNAVERSGKDIERLDPAALQGLMRYSWPGNVAELEEVLDEAVARAPGPILQPEHFPPRIHRHALAASAAIEPGAPGAMARRFVEQKARDIARALRNPDSASHSAAPS